MLINRCYLIMSQHLTAFLMMMQEQIAPDIFVGKHEIHDVHFATNFPTVSVPREMKVTLTEEGVQMV